MLEELLLIEEELTEEERTLFMMIYRLYDVE